MTNDFHKLSLSAAARSLGRRTRSAANLRGPLGDPQLVRNFHLGVNLHFPRGAVSDDVTAELHYSFAGPGLEHTLVLARQGERTYTGALDVPGDAERIHYAAVARDAGGQVILRDDAGAEPHVRRIHERAVSVTVDAANRAHVRYAGPTTSAHDTFLHVGYDDWKGAGDIHLPEVDRFDEKAGLHYHYNSANFELPWWASHLDFVFKDQRHGERWDNRDGHGWHFTIHPFVRVECYEVEGARRVNLSYIGGRMHPVILRYGVDGWQEPRDLTLTFHEHGNLWVTMPSLVLAPEARSLELAFHDGRGNWQSNHGHGWRIALDAAGDCTSAEAYCVPHG